MGEDGHPLFLRILRVLDEDRAAAEGTRAVPVGPEAMQGQ